MSDITYLNPRDQAVVVWCADGSRHDVARWSMVTLPTPVVRTEYVPPVSPVTERSLPSTEENLQ
jgi:hypothetical protein